jgi:amidohydrolase
MRTVLAAALCFLAASPAWPADLDASLDGAIAKALPALTELRHAIHQNPELGFQENATARQVAERLRAAGLEVRTGVAETGVVAILRGGLPGPTVAVRADMDALPVEEKTDLPFRSTKHATWEGNEVPVAHACGHDIHTTVILGVAESLAAVRAQLPGTVVFLFQPAEEGPPAGKDTGALAMVKAGVLQNPKPAAIFGIHSFADLAVGEVGWTAGPTYAAVDHFIVTLRGKQSHGAYPHLGIDPIVMGAQAVEAFQTIRSRTLSPFEPSVVTVGIFRGGERFNIIPGEVHLEGTVRTYSEETRATVERRMREILDGVAKANGGSWELDYKQNAPAVINDPALSARVRPSLEQAVGKEHVIDSLPTMGGEDFSYYLTDTPGFYFRLGVVKAGTTSGGLHTPDFRADDTAIPVGVRAMARVVLDYLRGGSAGAR